VAGEASHPARPDHRRTRPQPLQRPTRPPKSRTALDVSQTEINHQDLGWPNSGLWWACVGTVGTAAERSRSRSGVTAGTCAARVALSWNGGELGEAAASRQRTASRRTGWSW
jgi:hypothetical protein